MARVYYCPPSLPEGYHATLESMYEGLLEWAQLPCLSTPACQPALDPGRVCASFPCVYHMLQNLDDRSLSAHVIRRRYRVKDPYQQLWDM